MEQITNFQVCQGKSDGSEQVQEEGKKYIINLKMFEHPIQITK